ncbi:polyprenyl synthetase family protein [Tsukamurella paurometabola]|uniref:Heptaprenyl diphosphate synthase component 2 n=1 Tax=Tsukamurella paurometabola TaxID=2061 RepID=A0A3P8MA44_TSUPA|nr:polyprenyl synthetase family protein [Tsukamurella paurometabola]UEA85141.1 polyprenyl synthetase family protein [Tsukamurella paurometabola]VDR37750.1 Heptaprenyl diphosphate synthase component 2 [Tsukamurella paurometabola]
MEKTVAGVSLGSDEFAAGIRADLARVEQVIADGIAEADGCVIEEALHLFQAGGKRFRPMFTILSGRIGGTPSEQVITAAAAMELTHLATLYHDDVMDEADTRRGAPSANAKWGNSIAILAGDYLFARASAYGADLGPRAVGVIATCFGELVTGQMLELKGAGSGDPVQHYLDTIWGKTGSLIATCGLLGALHGGGDEETAQRMYRIGAAIGMAFQISDDIIDISSVAQESGKTPGTDLREGVFTLPVLYALRDEGPDADRLREILVGPVTDDALVDEAIELLGRSAGMKEAQATLARYADDARAELAELPESEPRASLESLVTFTVARLG